MKDEAWRKKFMTLTPELQDWRAGDSQVQNLQDSLDKER
jgi:hypothetical protein